MAIEATVITTDDVPRRAQTSDLHGPLGSAKKKKNEGKLQNYRPELASKNFFDQTTTNE